MLRNDLPSLPGTPSAGGESISTIGADAASTGMMAFGRRLRGLRGDDEHQP